MRRTLATLTLLAAFIPSSHAQQTASRHVPVVTSDPDYLAGARDRQIWENYVSSLPYGSFAVGHAYYAEHRYFEPVNCYDVFVADTSARDGCLHAYRFLSPIDAKLRTNTEYLYGWCWTRPSARDALDEGLRAIQQLNQPR